MRKEIKNKKEVFYQEAKMSEEVWREGQRKPHLVDEHVGLRLRMRRLLANVSQEFLGGQIGITFQQIQKYEKGLNRISAGRLYEIANVLDVPVSYFFEGLPNLEKSAGLAEERAKFEARFKEEEVIYQKIISKISQVKTLEGLRNILDIAEKEAIASKTNKD